VDPVMLMGDAVTNVSRWLLQGYLVGLRDQPRR
jgi:hypothetical protein